MTPAPSVDALDHRRGLIQLASLMLVLLGLYGAYQAVPVYLTHRAITRAVERSLGDDFRAVSDETIRQTILHAAAGASIGLDPAAIRITRDRRQGARVIEVDFEYPQTISFVGFSQTVRSGVHVAKVIRVPVEP